LRVLKAAEKEELGKEAGKGEKKARKK